MLMNLNIQEIDHPPQPLTNCHKKNLLETQMWIPCLQPNHAESIKRLRGLKNVFLLCG